jgi:hypothetical protein
MAKEYCICATASLTERACLLAIYRSLRRSTHETKKRGEIEPNAPKLSNLLRLETAALRRLQNNLANTPLTPSPGNDAVPAWNAGFIRQWGKLRVWRAG